MRAGNLRSHSKGLRKPVTESNRSVKNSGSVQKIHSSTERCLKSCPSQSSPSLLPIPEKAPLVAHRLTTSGLYLPAALFDHAFNTPSMSSSARAWTRSRKVTPPG